VLDEGAVGVTVDGIGVRTVVSQGCAPFGRESVITCAEGNVIHERGAISRVRFAPPPLSISSSPSSVR
jgi:small ligand-binding sensory domain FIST